MSNQNVSWFQKSDKMAFFTALFILLGIIGTVLTWPEVSLKIIGQIFGFLTGPFGWAYLLVGVICLVFAIWLALGPFANVKLGADDETPKYSFFTWFSMIVACGYGVGLVYWCVAEPLTFFATPPNGAEPLSPAAAERALAQSFFHWGWIPWAIYMSVAAPAGYFMFRKKAVPHFSTFLRPLFGDRVDSKFGRFVDGFLVYGVVGGVSTATGLGILQLAGGLESVFGIPQTTLTYVLIGAAWAALFTASVVSGVDRGIKWLSQINIPLCIAIGIAAFLIGPTGFIMNSTSSGIGEMIQNFATMSFWTDSLDTNNFPQNWTIFYWAWWIASAPSTGLFVAAISRGRTFKEIVLVHMMAAPVATWLWYGTFGATAIDLQLNQGVDLVASMQANGTGSTVFTVLETFPLSGLFSALFLLLVFIFLATTVNSYAYVCAQVTTKKEHNPFLPPSPIRAMWATLIAITAVSLVLVAQGEIGGLQTSSLLGSIVIALVMVLMMASMIKSLYEEFGDSLAKKNKMVSDLSIEKQEDHAAPQM